MLQHMLTNKIVDGIITSVPIYSKTGEPHYQIKVIRSEAELDTARSSHYHPVSYDQALEEIAKNPGRYALLGLPCIIQAGAQLPLEISKQIIFKFALACSHNVTGQFIDCMAKQEGIKPNTKFYVNLRDKSGDISDANNFNNSFTTEYGTLTRNRFKTTFTDMWRNYFFASESCLYCTDFLGADSDLSVKDAWGRLSKDPLGISLLVVRNPELVDILEMLQQKGDLHLESCDSDEIFNSQTKTFNFKHIKIRDRLVWKKSIRAELKKQNYTLGANRRPWHKNSIEYFRLLLLSRLSNFFYYRFKTVPVKKLIFASNFPKNIFSFTAQSLYQIKNILMILFRSPLAIAARFFGLRRKKRFINPNFLKVLIAGGYASGNIGDEAQLAANLGHWRMAAPECQLTVLTPNPHNTQKIHQNVQTALAPRISLFGKGNRKYFGSNRLFKWTYPFWACLYLFNASLIRAGLPTLGITARQAHLLDVIDNSDVLFLSGGGYLTGMTLTRLWDNMLLISLASAFGVPTILSGQTIGLFKDRISRLLARWGLQKAELIYLRDKIDSAKALTEIGIQESKVKSTFDDALFYPAAPQNKVNSLLQQHSINPDNPYLAVNVHYWGQKTEASRIIMRQTALALDQISTDHGLQIVFVPMDKSDEDAIKEVVHHMKNPSFFPRHNYDPGLAVGIIANSALCLTMKHHPIIFAMGAGVPTVSIVFDDYYLHKNRGAQEVFNQEKYIIHCLPVNLKKEITAIIKNIFNEINENTLLIKTRVKELEPQAGEVIYRWLSSQSLTVKK